MTVRSTDGSRRPDRRRRTVLEASVVTILVLMVAGASQAAKPGISLSVPGVALKGDIIKVKVGVAGGSEGISPYYTGMHMKRGYFDHCGWCDKPCLVNDQIQSCPTPPDGCCFNRYCLSCSWSGSHEFSETWYGGPTWEFEVTGCDTATLQASYYGGSHEGPFLTEEYEIIILDGIEPGMKVSDTDVCVGEEVDFADDSCGGTNYRWSFGDGHSASGAEVSHAYDTPGVYTVLLTVSSSHDTAQTSETVTVTGNCATVQGTITDIADGSPLPGAHVAIESVPHQRFTDSGPDGSYSVTVPPDVTYAIHVTRSGYYDSAPGSASPGNNETVTRNFALTPEVQDPIDPLADLGHEWINVDDPVNPATGNFVFSRRLFSLPGKAGLGTAFEVVYNSLDHDTDGPLGFGWTHAYNLSLSHSGGDYTLKLADGSRRFFHYDAGAEKYTPYNCRAFGTLANRSPDGWIYTMTGGVVYEFDAQGRLVRIVDSRGNIITLTHSTQLDRITDTAGRQIDLSYAGSRLTSITAPVTAGDTAVFAYDGAGNLISITDARGNAWTFAYDGGHRLLTEHDRRGVLVLTNGYDSHDRIVSQTDALGQTTTYAATAVGGNRTQVVITPPSGNAVTHIYDESFHLLRSTDGAGHTATFAYAANGSPASITDKLGRVASFEFADDGNLSSVTDRMGGSLQMSYDAHGLLTQSEDDLGNVLNIPRDPKGDPWWIFNPDNNAVQLWANGQGLITYMRDLRGSPWQIGRTAQGLVSTVQDPLRKLTTYHYDAAGWVTQVDLPDSLGSVQYTRDANGNLESVTSPEGLVTTYVHDEENNTTADTFVPTGATTTYTYDDLGRLHTITDALAGVTTYAYDADSNLIAVTDGDGVTVHAAYNARNEIVSVTSASGSQTTFGYDANGRRTSVTDALGNTWSFAHDAEGRLTSTTDPLGHSTSILRSADEKTTTIVDPAGRQTVVLSNAMGDPETTILPNGDVVSEHRDPGGALDRLTDARGTSWALSRNILGRMVGITGPDGTTERYEHDAVGRLTTVTRRGGDTVAYEYDLDGRLTAAHLP
ncbi:MAG TPA: PKD domain-containing protein, partial [Acidobacteria bacterium]|nr:PKD domain-containing protein [Acidobacteriota bacterium]